MLKAISFLGASLVCVTLALPIHAEQSQQECSDVVVNSVGKFLKIKSFNAKSEDDGIVASACKVSPNDSDKVYSVFAYTVGQKKIKTSNEPDTKQLIVATVSLASQQVVGSYQGEIEEDAVTEVGSFRIDTARYQLTKNLRAFGVVFNSSARGPSCADGRWSEELTLYTQQNSQLVPVLNLPLEATRALQGCLGQSTKVKGVWETANLSISVTKSESNGYADLLLTTKIVREFDDGTTPAVKKKDENRLMRFDGKTYKNSQTPAWWLLFN